MTDQMRFENTERVFQTLCESLNDRGWHYSANDKDYTVKFDVNGDDITMHFTITLLANLQLIQLVSPLPFRIPEDKRLLEGAVATCVASYGLLIGNFDYNVAEGLISFRATTSYRDSEIGKQLFHALIGTACHTVDQYNDKFLAIGKGMLSLSDFIAEEFG